LLLKTNKANLNFRTNKNLDIKKLCLQAFPSKKFCDALNAYLTERAHQLKYHQMNRGNKGNHYCGRKDMYFCKMGCDGRCGPTSGCNCADCGIFDLIEGVKPWKHRTPGPSTCAIAWTMA